jgi:predicted DNA-binding protein with PD1-like motif
VVKTLPVFAREKRLVGGHFTAIGALREVTLGYFDWVKKDHQRIPIREPVEVVFLLASPQVTLSRKRQGKREAR